MISALVLISSLATAAPPRDFLLSADEWARPRSGERVVALESVHDAVAVWLSRDDSNLVIFYPGGETGSLWASELRDWLVALGLPMDRIELRPGSPRDDAILLQVDPSR